MESGFNKLYKVGSLKYITFSILVLASISCAISIVNNDLYLDGEWANAQWLGQDIATLFVAIPLLLLSYQKSIKTKKWETVLSGTLFYFVYTYSFFVFEAKLTFLYFFHLPIFSLSLIGLFISLKNTLAEKRKYVTKNNSIKRLVLVYLLLISGMLSFLWLSDIVSHITIPNYKSDTPSGEPLLIVYTLDLAIVIPLMMISVIGYYKNRQYGIKLIGVMLTKTSTLGIALMAMSLSMYLQKLSLDLFLAILWFSIGIIGTTLSLFFLKDLREESII
ncbi:hypothetical protein GGR42_002683 [Saonia flava]|uniref:Uncharacterized protein n=1 Tax=Saonia flava TaxID=523696 RepID=A0A846QZU2_9FLAO|nr:hypothetical protein [Saonia flava]NJB72192.1 hypothetical protein [Saonia flava]